MTLRLFTPERTIGFASLWFQQPVRGHNIIAIPRLRLEQDPAMDLAELRINIPQLFKGLRIEDQATGEPSQMAIAISGTSSLLKTGSPSMVEVILLVPKPGIVLPSLGSIISSGSEMLIQNVH